MLRPRRLVFLALFLVGAACGGSGLADVTEGGSVPSTLRVGLIPNVAPEQQRARYAPLGEYLERSLRTEVKLFVASDYAGVVAALAGGRIDVAYLGGLTYVQAEQQVGLTPLVTEVDVATGTERYISAVVVRADSGLADLGRDVVAAGRSFAFGDVSSTSGSLYPRLMLTAAGARCSARDLVRCPPLGRVVFTGGHDATAQAVLSGQVDAGGVELRILRRLERDGKVPPGALRVIAEREVQGYPWVMRTALPAEVRRAVTEAFTALRDPALLDLVRARGYVPVQRSDYDEIRREASRLGLLEVKGSTSGSRN